jgi:hypothetical protein
LTLDNDDGRVVSTDEERPALPVRADHFFAWAPITGSSADVMGAKVARPG